MTTMTKDFNQQQQRVWAATANQGWFSLEDIAKKTGDKLQSISARLRDFRKLDLGSHTVERRAVERGQFVYRVIPNV